MIRTAQKTLVTLAYGIGLLLTLTTAAFGQQSITLEPGDTLTIDALVVEPDTVYETILDTVYIDRCDEWGWECYPPESGSLYELHVTEQRSGSGVVENGDSVASGIYFIHLERADGSWSGLGEVEAPGVDSVVFVFDGGRNRERLYPYETPSGNTPIELSGAHSVAWEVFGLEPDAATVEFVASDGDPPPGVVLPEERLERIFGVARNTPSGSDTYDAEYEEWGDYHWARNGTQWEYYYYDRGLGWYAAWWRGEGDEYLARAAGAVDAYLDDYVNGVTEDGTLRNGEIPPRWSFVEGLAIDYLVRGTPLALEMIEAIAVRLDEVWMDNFFTTPYQDGRIQGRTVMAQLIAYEMTGKQVYRENLDVGIENLIAWFEREGNGFWPMRSYCYGQANFQLSHAILDVLIRYHDLVDEDRRIPTIVGASLDRMWGYWTPGAGFDYMSEPQSVPCIDDNGNEVGNTDPAPDLNLLIVPPWYWYADWSGDELYRDRADEIFDTGLGVTYFGGYKQFNQSYMRSWRARQRSRRGGGNRPLP